MQVLTVGDSRLVLVRDDITRQDTDAIVNAANTSLLGGGGVDGAIHRAGGPQILEECRSILARQGGCPTGQAVVTGGGRLKARFVIHAVGPVWRGGGHGEDAALRSAYAASLAQAIAVGAESVSFPCISTGIYGFPIERAARIACDAVAAFVTEHRRPREVRFVVFSPRDYEVYARLIDGAPPRTLNRYGDRVAPPPPYSAHSGARSASNQDAGGQRRAGERESTG